MSEGTRLSDARQACASISSEPGAPVALARLFSLRPQAGAVTVADLAPARAACVAAKLAADDVRFVLEDVFAPDPSMTPETQRLDARAHGARLAEALALLSAELDVLTVIVRAEGGRHA